MAKGWGSGVMKIIKSSCTAWRAAAPVSLLGPFSLHLAKRAARVINVNARVSDRCARELV